MKLGLKCHIVLKVDVLVFQKEYHLIMLRPLNRCPVPVDSHITPIENDEHHNSSALPQHQMNAHYILTGLFLCMHASLALSVQRPFTFKITGEIVLVHTQTGSVS